MDQTYQYFEALYASKPSDALICVWRLDNKQTQWFRVPSQAAEYAIANRECDLYAQIGIGSQDTGRHSRLKAEQVTGIPGLWIDFDIEGGAHQKKNLPHTVTEALAILPEELPPSMIVNSGHGAHAYWLFKEILMFESEEDRQRAARALQQWERLIRLRAQTHNWTIDAVHDLSRILRIPGTRNNKEKDHGLIVDCVLTSLNDRRYNLSEFEDLLEGVPGLNTPPGVAAHTIATPTPAMDSLTLAPDRSFAKLDFFLHNEAFRAIWNHTRADMSDNSQSGYDLAICNILFRAGLDDQEIVDAMIHNRRHHGNRAKLRMDYHQRTLARARNRIPGGYSAEDINSGKVTIMPDKNKTTLEEIGLAYESLSVLLNLMDDGKPNILRIIKMTGAKTVWRIDLKTGNGITITSPNGILVKERMKAAILAACNRKMPKYKADGWEKVTDEFIAATIDIPAGLDNTATGEVHRLLEDYLQANGVKSSQEEAFRDPRTTYLPFENKGRIVVDAPDFREWVTRRRNEKFESSDIANRLSAIGAAAIDLQVAEGRQKQSRWLLPPCFEPATWRDLAAQAGFNPPERHAVQ